MDPLAIPGAIPVEHADDVSSDGSPLAMLDGQDEVLFDSRDFGNGYAATAEEFASDSEADENAGPRQGNSNFPLEHEESGHFKEQSDFSAEGFEEDDDLPLDPPAGVTIDEWARLRRLRIMSKAHVHDGDKQDCMDSLLTAFCVFLVWGSLAFVVLNLACLATTGAHLPGVSSGYQWAQDAVARTWSFTRQPLHTHMMPVFDPEYAAALPSDQGLYEAYMHGSAKQRRKIVETFTEGSADARDVAMLSQQRREDAMQKHRWSLDGSTVVSAVGDRDGDGAAPPPPNYEGIDARVQRYNEMVRKRREKVSMWPPPHAAQGAFADADADATTARQERQQEQVRPIPGGKEATGSAQVAVDGSLEQHTTEDAAQAFLSRRQALIKAGLPPDVAEAVAAKEMKLAAQAAA